MPLCLAQCWLPPIHTDHLEAAGTDAATHCPHASGAAPCGDLSPATMYCANYAATCSSADSFADTAACAALYDSYAPGTAGDTSGATQGCIRCESAPGPEGSTLPSAPHAILASLLACYPLGPLSLSWHGMAG